MTTGTAAPDRVNASILLDRNLEAGREGKIALITADGDVRYGELARLVAGVAAYLRETGITREQRVLMILDDSPAFHATFLGAMRVGAVPVPVNPMDRVDNFEYYLEDSYARAVVIDAALAPSLEASFAGRPDVLVMIVGGDAGPHVSFDAVVGDRAADLPAPVATHGDD